MPFFFPFLTFFPYLCPRMTTTTPFSRPIYVMAKPVGAMCNLACQYCYYLDKSQLYPETARTLMDDHLLEQFIRDYIAAQTSDSVLFTWHGGEPLLRPVSFYQRVIHLQQRHAGGRHIENVIQTNGTRIDDRWATFFHDHHWLVGVSIDGPRRFHDSFRKNRAHRGSFDDVMRGIDCLNRHHVEWNAMSVVNHLIADHPLEWYHFFKKIGARYIQFTPVVERIRKDTTTEAGRSVDDIHLPLAAVDEEGALAPYSVTPEQWGSFLYTLFDEWVRNDVAEYYIQIFDATLANWMGVAPGVCTMAETCGHAAAIEWNGDLYSCDHFVFPEYRLGNIRQRSIYEMMNSQQQRAFGEAKRSSLPHQCKTCQWLFACHGECPRNRFCRTADGERGLNYLCDGYRKYFAHVAPYMDYMRQRLLHEQAPAMIMEAIRRGEIPTEDNNR